MKTKMIFAIAALLMLGSVCLNAQENSNGSTPNDYSKLPFTIVPLEKDMTVWFLGERDDHVTESINVFYSYDGGETWIEKGFGDHRTISVNLGQKVSLRVNNCSSAWGIQNKNSEDKIVGRFNVEGVLERMSPCDGYKGYFKGMTTLVSAENLIIPEDTYCEEMFAGCTSLTKAPVLSASTLSENQYKNMFNGCTSLNYIKCLATGISASGCTDGWLDGVYSSGTFVKNASMNNWPTGASGIPSGWTVTNAQASKIKRTIHVATAGTLPNLISEDEKYEIEELTLTGELNGTDLAYLREMAGKASQFTENTDFDSHIEWANFRSTGGKLSVIDMSGVNIISGGVYLTIYEQVTIYNIKEYTVQANEIPFFVFGGCGLTSITIPNSVTSIGIKAFCGCSNLTSVTIPNTVTSIGDYVFEYCSGLTSVAIPNSVTSIGNGAFAGCSGLTFVTIPNSVTSIGGDAFRNCSALTSITIPNNVTSIGGDAFRNCSTLTSITIPNTVTSIGDWAFEGCSSLTSVTIPNSVTSIGRYAFNGTAWYNNQPDGLLYAGKVAYSYKGEMPANTSISLQEGTLGIAGCVFYGCSGLTSITIPNSVKSIGDRAFYGCSGLTSVAIPNSVTSIGSYAFSGCSGLTSITIPKSVTFIRDGTFKDCSGLTSIVSQINNPLGISDGVFPSNIYSTATLTVPFGTKSLYEVANGWNKFSKITESPSVKRTIRVDKAGTLSTLIGDESLDIEELTLTGEINGSDFSVIRKMAGKSYSNSSGIESLSSDDFPDTDGKLSVLDISGVKIVSGGMYLYLDGRTDGDVPVSLAQDDVIPPGIFYGCKGLTSISVPSGLKNVGAYAFDGTSWYENQPDGLVYIGNVLYKYKGDMPENFHITIKEGTIGIANSAFYGRSTLSSIVIPESVKYIGIDNTIYPPSHNPFRTFLLGLSNSNVFANCTSLTSINIPNSVTNIGIDAFSGTPWYNNQPDGLVYAGKVVYKYKGEMPANTSITIKDGTIGITNSAFYGCSGLTSITIPNSVTYIGSDAFYGCSGLTSVTIPNSVTSIAYMAFLGCSSLTSVTIPNSVTSIGQEAFSGCSGLTSITIPNSVKSIGEAFSGCSGLTKVVSKIMEPFKINSFTFPSDIYSNAELVVPAGTKSLYEAANGWKSFSKITESPAEKRTIHVATAGTLPNLISEDEKYQIEELTLTGELNGTDFRFIRDMAGDVVSTIRNELQDLIVCHNPTEGILKSLDISNAKIVKGGDDYNYIRNPSHGVSGLSTLDDKITPGLFYQTNLETIILPNSITSIEGKEYRYMYFTGDNTPGEYEGYEEGYIGAFPETLSSITIPNSVTSIGKFAFLDCSGLISITIPNSVTSIGDNAFSGCSGLTSVIMSNSLTSIGQYAFQGCSGLTSVTIPPQVTSIGYRAFFGCSGLTTISIPNSVTSIGSSAFSGTAWYNNQPDGLVYAGKIAYKYKGMMPANTSVIIKDGTLGITGEAFSGCSGLTSITIPNSVTSIGGSAFSVCSGLTSVTIPNSVTSIGGSAFSACSGLTSVTIPSNVTTIGNYAFYNCSNLRMVVSKIKNPFTIGSSVFSSDIYTNAELIVPTGTKSYYEAADGWNKFSKIMEHLPTLETQPAQPTSTTKARLIALANEEDDDQHYGFEWLRYDAPQEMPANKVSAPLYDGRIIGSLGGLNPDIYYKYRPFYKSDTGEMVYGEWIPFLTGDANVFFEPEVHTKDAVVSNDGALLSAVFVEGTEDIQEKGFEYWQKNSNARAVSLTRGNNIGSVIVSGNNTSVTIEGLKAGTEYGYRSYVKTASGITYGEEKTFKTSMFGDVNGDNKVDSNDLNDLVSYIMGIIPPHFNKDVADLNNDNKVNAADIVKMVNILK